MEHEGLFLIPYYKKIERETWLLHSFFIERNLKYQNSVQAADI